MRARLLLCLLAAAPLAAEATAPRDVVQLCASEAPEGARGLQALEQACPALGPALDALGVVPLLSAASRDHLTPAMLADATDLATARATRPPPGLATLRPILRGMAGPAEARGWWARFVEWLRHYLGQHLPAHGPSWLQRILNAIDVSPNALGLILYGLVLAVIAGAAWIVYTELKAAGVLQRPGARAGRSDATLHPATPEPVTLGALERLPAGERVGALFRLVVTALEARSGASARAQTHRQLRDAATLPDAESARRFDALACTAEEQLYAPTPVSADRLDAAISAGVTLYATLAGRRTP